VVRCLGRGRTFLFANGWPEDGNCGNPPLGVVEFPREAAALLLAGKKNALFEGCRARTGAWLFLTQPIYTGFFPLEQRVGLVL